MLTDSLDERNEVETMKRLLSALLVLGLACVLATVAGYAATMYEGYPMAGSGTLMQCELDFRDMDSGNKGFLTSRDLYHAYYPPGQIKGPSPVGKAYSLFATYDRDNDNRMTVDEYCAWKAR
jgi:hypothetical protein